MQPDSDAQVVDVVGLLLAVRAMQRVGPPASLRLTGLLERGSGWPRAERSRLHDLLRDEHPGAVVAGRPVVEPVGSARWLAWFPRPLGPRHAVSVPSPVPAALHRRLRSAQALSAATVTIRCHLAVRSWQAEVLQALAQATSWGWVDRRLRAWAGRGPDAPDPRARWACVVEVLDVEGRLVRGWAHGVDRGRLAALLVDEPVPDGPTPAQAAAVLDRLALPPERGGAGLRWSVGTPAMVGP